MSERPCGRKTRVRATPNPLLTTARARKKVHQARAALHSKVVLPKLKTCIRYHAERENCELRAPGERAKRASLDEDENTRDESREMAIDIMATSTTKLTHSILLTRFTRFALVSSKMCLAALGAETRSPLSGQKGKFAP